jgi:hypothetical protein
MSNRTHYQVQLRVVKPGASRIHRETIRGTTSDAWEPGYILTLTNDGKAATLPTTINDDISGPVKYVALAEYAGVANEYVPLEEIAEDTVFEAQISTGSADADDIGKQGVLVQDPTTGNYAVDISSDRDASVEVVDAEPNFQPYGKYATGNYNLVWFKFLPEVLEIAPATPAS